MVSKVQAKPLVRIVDDDPSLRKALAYMVKTEGWEVKTYENATSFLAGDAPSIAGCLVLDVSMPDMNGLELHEELRRRGYEVPIIFLTAHGDVDMAVHSLKHGAVDFLLKPVNNERFLSAITEAVERDLTRRGWKIEPHEEKQRFDSLTKREEEVIRLIAQGHLNRTVAQRLGLSERTIEVHRAGACRKLKLLAVSDIARLIAHVDALKLD